MKKYLDKKITYLEELKNKNSLSYDGEIRLTLLKEIKQQLALCSVGKSVTCDSCGESDIEWYCNNCYDEAGDSLPY